VVLDRAVDLLPPADRARLAGALEQWLEQRVARLLGPLRRLAGASREFASGAALRALALRLVEGGGVLPREAADLDRLSIEQRQHLRRLGVTVGALDVFAPAVLRAEPLALWVQLARLAGIAAAPAAEVMPPVRGEARAASGYRRAGKQWLRVDMAEKLLRAAHAVRVATRRKRFALNPELALSMGLTTASYAHLLRAAGFRPLVPRPLGEDVQGPPAPLLWEWRPGGSRSRALPSPSHPTEQRPDNAFAALAGWRAG
jgi:ATP-dependent RNA helicase SUPV3L1/SUV3